MQPSKAEERISPPVSPPWRSKNEGGVPGEMPMLAQHAIQEALAAFQEQAREDALQRSNQQEYQQRMKESQQRANEERQKEKQETLRAGHSFSPRPASLPPYPSPLPPFFDMIMRGRVVHESFVSGGF